MSYNSPFTGNVIQPTDVSYRAITLSADLQLAWPINGNTADDAAARIMEVTATNNAQLWMPPANQASVGQDALIRNVGVNAFTVYDFTGANTIATIAAGEAQYIYITENPDVYGTWGVIAYGIGSSGADAATLAGYGLLAVTTTLNQSHPVTTFSSNATADSTFRAQAYVWTGGAGTMTLTSAATLGDNWFMFVRNNGSGALTVTGSGGNTINGSSTIALQPTDSAIIVCSGTTFYTVGLGKSTQFNFTQLTKAVTTGTYTLTASEASNVIQKYTGTLTGNVTIIVPPTVQVYYIINETVGGPSNFTVTISTGSGGTASLTGGNQATLICDSVNLFNANTILAGTTSISLANGTVGSPSLNFAAETGTGVYRGAAGEFDIAILGVNLFTLNATGLTINGTLNGTAITGTTISGTTITGTSLVTGNGSAAAPSISFTGNTNTGFYRASANTIGVSANGSQVATFGTTGLNVTGVGAFTGAVSGTTGSFSGAVTGASYSGGAVSGTTGTFTGAVSGDTGTFVNGITGGTF